MYVISTYANGAGYMDEYEGGGACATSKFAFHIAISM